MKIARWMYKDLVFEGRVEDGILVSSQSSGKDVSFKQEDVKFLSPVKPSKIVCVGLNYYDHAQELGMDIPEEPVIFLKPPSSIIGNNGSILSPVSSKRVDFEGELAVVIAKETRDVSPERTSDHILGYTCFNDVTARDLQKKDGQWTRAKAFDTFSPIGPWVQTALDPRDISIKTFLNGAEAQYSRTSKMIFSVFELISFISSVMTLLPGDVISTGTPKGIGPMFPGDEVVVEIEGIGRLVNRVVGRQYNDN